MHSSNLASKAKAIVSVIEACSVFFIKVLSTNAIASRLRIVIEALRRQISCTRGDKKLNSCLTFNSDAWAVSIRTVLKYPCIRIDRASDISALSQYGRTVTMTIGMHPQINDSIHPRKFPIDLTVYDLVVQKGRTTLVKDSQSWHRAAGAS